MGDRRAVEIFAGSYSTSEDMPCSDEWLEARKNCNVATKLYKIEVSQPADIEEMAN